MGCGKKITAAVLVMICVLALCGCGKKENEAAAKVVYEYGECTVTYGEYYIYAKTIAEDYQKSYGSGIWSLELTTDEGQSSVRDVTIRDIIADINRVKVLIAQAEDLKVALSDNEKAEAENTASTFYNGLTEKDIRETEVTKELVEQVIEENMLAEKVYKQIIADYDFEISEEEARMSTFYDMVFECYEAKQDGTVEEFTDEKKAAQLQRANEALSTLAQEEDVSYDEIVKQYDLQYSASYTMSRAELVEEYGEIVADRILELSDGAVSAVIQSEYGYHIFKMFKANDEELTKKNKEEIIAQKQKEYFSGVYGEWVKKYQPHFSMEDVNMELVNKFPFAEE
ncbi:MAG: peptidyl-prolyl cis-trans isomerase [Lachnospiraceae bacterium]|nr:peptidyl-prolyl cis-trans isomerase [Lachnospiraceae bacterium]